MIWPARCAACESDAGSDLCTACEQELVELSTRPACPHCGRPGVAHACGWCGGKGDGPVKAVWRLGVYEAPLAHLVRRAKFDGRWELCRSLGERLAGVCELGDDVVLVPVPLHAARRASRGYDQAALVAEALGGRLKLPVVHALRRRRHTQPQTSLQGSTARSVNLRDAFALHDAEAVEGRRVVLVDDVMTSGSTLRAAARTLAPAKPAWVGAAVLAVATREQEAKASAFDE